MLVSVKNLLLLLSSISMVSLTRGREFTATDMNIMPKAGVPVADAAHNRYVFTVNTWDQASNKKTQVLHLGKLDAAGIAATLAPVEGKVDANPLWVSAHSTLLFVSNRGSSGQLNLWGVKVADDNTFGEPYQVTDYPVSIETAKIRGEGLIAFSAAVYPGLTFAQTVEKDKEIADSPVKVQEWDKTFVRRWNFFYEGKFSHVFIQSIKYDAASDKIVAVGEPTDVMGGMEGDCPSKPFGDEGEYAISNDGKYVAFTTQVGNDKAWSTDLNVYEYDIEKKTIDCISCENKATDTAPAYSPDDKYIAYLAMKTERYESDTKHIRIFDRSQNTSQYVAYDWDRSVDSIAWSEDGKTLYAGAADEGYGCYFSVDIAKQTVQKLLGEHTSSGLNIIPCDSTQKGAGQICALYARSDLAHPSEIFRSNADGTSTQLTSVTAGVMAEIDMTRYFDLRIPGANGDLIQAWFHKPFNWRPGRKYPLVLYIHGGPESPWEDMFHYRWNPQLIAAQGYAVLAPNFHGSQSFGEEFTRSILNDWGGKPYEDLMKSVEYIIEKYDWVDGDRVGAMGASYGGYMINWINSQTDRFKCLVCHDGFFDTFSMYWQTDELYFPDTELGGIPTDPEANKRYKKWSPSSYADRMNTPELVIHGAMDYRIPDVAAISLFNNLQRRGVDSAFIRFPNADHFILDPNDSIYWHSEVIAWLDKYLK